MSSGIGYKMKVADEFVDLLTNNEAQGLVFNIPVPITIRKHLSLFLGMPVIEAIYVIETESMKADSNDVDHLSKTFSLTGREISDSKIKTEYDITDFAMISVPDIAIVREVVSNYEYRISWFLNDGTWLFTCEVKGFLAIHRELGLPTPDSLYNKIPFVETIDEPLVSEQLTYIKDRDQIVLLRSTTHYQVLADDEGLIPDDYDEMPVQDAMYLYSRMRCFPSVEQAVRAFYKQVCPGFTAEEIDKFVAGDAPDGRVLTEKQQLLQHGAVSITGPTPATGILTTLTAQCSLPESNV